MRATINIASAKFEAFQKAMPAETRNHSMAVILDSNQLRGWGNGCLEYMAALGALDTTSSGLPELKRFHQEKKDWLLGFITYDYKNQLEELTSCNSNQMPLPDLCFFQPRYLFIKDQQGFRLEYPSEAHGTEIEQLMERLQSHATIKQELPTINFQPRVEAGNYKKRVAQIQENIHRGDIYELNYCIEYFAAPAQIDPTTTWLRLIEASPTPFSAFVKHLQHYTLCASPERYLLHTNGNLVSQPIKGTAARAADPETDAINKMMLATSEKERAENIMITDLVRNDLSRIAKQGSVKVEELCGLYGFRQVWQMITTITARLDENHHWTDALATSFPMGSMTGAPKIKAMQLIDSYEVTKRGIYSGAIGYITPAGDFDFNVVIRSLFYNAQEGFLSFMVGSAITIGSKPEEEFKECQMKAAAMRKIFNQQP
ncbi:MAG: anthranilate synthase component I family protein [Breznakibacter sp.]